MNPVIMDAMDIRKSYINLAGHTRVTDCMGLGTSVLCRWSGDGIETGGYITAVQSLNKRFCTMDSQRSLLKNKSIVAANNWF